ncbi:hypothetical protein Zmor_010431 [Zophobas morio]|uniref:Major facilitator superfamily (MFS) profile domain-containing protein n=1 Tax=Zophobas morio TaxID=2755281 RepID=A0AA38IRV3_9CUCU|nr:hypothetical protein Zmor_010431 [Zophobas morio]
MQPTKTNIFLYLVAILVNLLSFSIGVSITWITSVIPKVDGSTITDDNPFGRLLTASEISWIAGFLPLGAAIGPLAVGKISDKIGRKKSLLILGCVNILSLVITVFAKQTVLFYISRFLAGVVLGSSYSVIPVFMAEISENHNRGALGCSVGIFVAIGMNFALVAGPYLSISVYSLLCISPLLIFVPGFFILSPETPWYLAARNDEKRLTKSLLKLRNKTVEEIHLEMTSILEVVVENETAAKAGVRDLCTNNTLRKSLLICLVIICLQQCGGIAAVLIYMPKIFEAAKTNLAPEICAIIVGVFQVFGTIVSSVVVDRLGRRILLLVSSVFTCLTLVTLGLYFRLNLSDVVWLSWLPLFSLVVYIFTFNVGLGPVPWVVMSELFPSNFTSIAAALTSSTCFMNTFIVTVTFPYLSTFLGMANCFFLFTVVTICGAIFIYMVLPETKGKSLQEIQKLLGSCG